MIHLKHMVNIANDPYICWVEKCENNIDDTTNYGL